MHILLSILNQDSEKDWSSKFEALQVEMEKVRAESAEYKDQLSQSQQEFEERQNLTKEVSSGHTYLLVSAISWIVLLQNCLYFSILW